MNNKNKSILITGGGKGIGETTVKFLSKQGINVFTLIKDKKDNKKFKNYKNIKIFNGNVNNEKLIRKIFKESRKKNFVINGLVNNAGIRLRKDFNQIKKKDLINIFNTNFFSIFRIMQIFSEFLIKEKKSGAVVNISSIVGQIGFKQLAAYASTKGALISLTKSFATEMAEKKIRANSISPGFVKTSYFNKFKNKKKNLYKWTVSRIPMKRWGESQEISETINFLLSEKSSYMTGENINLDGGWLSS